MEHKVCGTCGVNKQISQFSLKHGSPQYNCKECHSKYRKEHYHSNKQKYIDKAKRNRDLYRREYYDWLSTKSCVDCGNNDVRVLEQDHLENKEFNVSSLVGRRTLKSMIAELEKCEVVCANCHRIRTIERGSWTKSQYAVLS